ncbi:MAG: carboxypeptidase-like regulatory domain-containing protein [Bacteroidales bacterium]|nr:carboxypeptidase-like regulatory domain-containing protein [Bacteroidales bacterium]
MKTRRINQIRMIAVVFMLFVTSITNGWALDLRTKSNQDSDTLSYRSFKGKIIDAQTKKPLVFASVTVEDENTATITNLEGEFLIKISKKSKSQNLFISFLGYYNLSFPLIKLKAEGNILELQPAVITLNEVQVFPDSPESIVRAMLRRIGQNYANEANAMKGFYRESIKKRNTYVGLSEAVVDIYKAPYTSYTNDRIRIFRGRKGMNERKMDTLLFKLQGGPVTSLLLDAMKNPDILIDEEMLQHYEFTLENMVKIDHKLNYVIAFKERHKVEDFPLYEGKFYLDVETLALTSADFSLNLDKPIEASRLFIRKKPFGAKVIPTVAKYSIRYREQNGKWYFNYAIGEVQFKVKWKKKLFSTTYTLKSEIAITDRDEQNVEVISNKDRFKRRDVLNDKVGVFADENFWGKYNTIEPDKSIEVAIRKLNRVMNR